MSDSQDRAAIKQSVRDRLLSLEEEALAAAKSHYESFLKDAVMDRRESHDKDEMADARESADLAAAFDAPVYTHQAKIDAIENTDFSPTDTVGPGAVVSFNGRNFVVITSTSKFDCGGKTYMGISTQSPIYRVIEGLKAGDSFSHNGRTYTLEDVI
ncbi:hypothetical protein [Pontibaca salina]|uniref:Transcription elongation factor n=1 Tax=Pontibaca salina TaxID=2795731 RepID=A0A934HL99_9RHOB|nr:hypothetical protein [Pontibaca salina]MBI6630183.1 hypothetical protein [Pontibaca salina]